MDQAKCLNSLIFRENRGADVRFLRLLRMKHVKFKKRRKKEKRGELKGHKIASWLKLNLV